jgi:lipopolysaccharide/colanic/teichoic acid biosynthesis glycosyltransferase
MRVLFITQYYPPETGAAPARAYHFARGLARRGHDVTVVTGMPNHPSGVKHAAYRWRMAAREEHDDIKVRRCSLYASPKKTFARRLLNQFSFMLTSFFGSLTVRRSDIVLVTSPPLFLGITAWLIAILKGVPFVLDVRDYWPHAAVALGQLSDRRIIRCAERLEMLLYRHAAMVVAVTPGMVRLIKERGISEQRVVLITNGSDTETFTPGERSVDIDEECMTVLYSGTHGLVHGMDVIIETADILRDDKSLRFLLIGDGVAKDRLVSTALRKGLTNIEFRSSLRPVELATAIHCAGVCIATTDGSEFSRGTIPVKLFDYMACGRPVVAALEGDGAECVNRSGGGIVVTPGDAGALAEALKRLADDGECRERLGKAGSEFVAREYSRGILAEKMEELLDKIVAAERSLKGKHLAFRRYLAIKYTLDFVGALLLIVLGAPIFLAAAIVVRLDSRGRTVFRQRRIGIHSHEFTILKFRTMKEETPDLATDLIVHEDVDYTTRVGRILRKTGADELPNLINILRGEMSIVGPRPALYNQYELIDLRCRTLGDLVRPGLTGWAQINGRDAISLDEKVRLDAFYVKNCSFLLDLKICMRTVFVLCNTE